jgi:hypothetical protein
VSKRQVLKRAATREGSRKGLTSRRWVTSIVPCPVPTIQNAFWLVRRSDDAEGQIEFRLWYDQIGVQLTAMPTVA